MSEETFEGYLAGWRRASPQREVAWLFLRAAERVRFVGLAALQEEWMKALRDISEPRVAAVKLSWWREEMERAARGDARHPLGKAVFADPRIRAVPVAHWVAAIDAALLAIGWPPAQDFAAQRAAVAPLARALAGQETFVAYGPTTASDKAAALLALGYLAAGLRRLPGEVGHGRSPLPMNLLARHGLTTEALLNDRPERRAALRDYAAQLVRALAGAARMAGQLTLIRRVQLQCDARSLRVCARSRDPLRAVQAHRGVARDLLKIWRAARSARCGQLEEGFDATP